MSRRPGRLPLRRAIRLTIPGSGSTLLTSMPGMAAKRASVVWAIAVVLLGGLGEATRTRAWTIPMSRGRSRSTSWDRASRTPLLVSKTALPEPDGHRKRPANEKIDQGNKGEDLQGTEGRG